MSKYTDTDIYMRRPGKQYGWLFHDDKTSPYYTKGEHRIHFDPKTLKWLLTWPAGELGRYQGIEEAMKSLA